MAATSRSRKILVTNRRALTAKYGASGVKAIQSAVKALAAADARRGFATSLVFLDGAALGAARVTDPSDPAEHKAAVDAVAKRHRPEYLVILGAPDVVPYQDLKNKLHDPADPDSDPDRFAGSDLPYACEAPYSQNVAMFLGPTRVVGRIPDLVGASTPTYLLKQLAASATATPAPRPDSCFALSAKVWVKSTTLSVRNILGAVPVVLTSPTAGPSFAAAQLRQRVHFVNCHGNESDHTFSGEFPKDVYATAMDARKLAGISPGTVAAFECCYGAELYAPAGLPAMSIANTYLARRAAGVVAATTIAYGPAVGNANADVICQLFLEQVLKGASLGRALLEARLAYVRQQSVVDPYDEKTLAQFVLLGDPSLHPFVDGTGTAPTTAKSPRANAAAHAARLQRRVRLMTAGERLSRETAYTVPAKAPRQAAAVLRRTAMASLRRRFAHVRAFRVHEPAVARQLTGKALRDMPKAELVFVATKRRPTPAVGPRTPPRIDGLLAYQVDGEIVTRLVESR
ncbi:MAG: hypothetical protein AB7U83_22750 [Vicinamibacterales bacterium]